MSVWRDLMWIATRSLRSRRARMAMTAVGPLIGVAVIVTSVGVLRSAEAEVAARLDRLGRDLIVVHAADGDVLPAEAADRAYGVPGVVSTGWLAPLPGSTGRAGPSSGSDVVASLVAVGSSLEGVLRTDLVLGRRLLPSDERSASSAAIVGADVGERLGLADEPQVVTVFVGSQPFAVVGVLGPSELLPDLDGAVIISQAAAERLLGADVAVKRVLVRATPDRVRDSARLLPAAITYGEGSPPSVQISSDLLEAQVEVDETLGWVLIALGVLSMAVGAFGIANTMLMAVTQRRREIGVRRAVGHPAGLLGAEFVIEAVVVGSAGALAGLFVSWVTLEVLASARQSVAVIDATAATLAVVGAVTMSVAATLYPASVAARIEPADAMRAD